MERAVPSTRLQIRDNDKSSNLSSQHLNISVIKRDEDKANLLNDYYLKIINQISRKGNGNHQYYTAG